MRRGLSRVLLKWIHNTISNPFATNKEIPIPVIAQSIMELFRSRDKGRDTYRAIAMMRRGFGGHPFGKDEKIAAERKLGRTKLL